MELKSRNIKQQFEQHLIQLIECVFKSLINCGGDIYLVDGGSDESMSESSRSPSYW